MNPNPKLNLFAGIFLCQILCFFCSACEKGRKPTFLVQGKVIYQGKPAKSALVSFHPLGKIADANPRIMPNADCDKNGNFTLSTYLQGDGAPEGEYAVTIFWMKKVQSKAPDPNEPANEDPDDEDAQVEEINRLPAKYGNKDQTPLRFTVQSTGTNQADFIIP